MSVMVLPPICIIENLDIRYSSEDGGFIAILPDYPSITAFGETIEEALKEIQVAFRLWYNTCKDQMVKEAKKKTNVEKWCQVANHLRYSSAISVREFSEMLDKHYSADAAYKEIYGE